MASASVALVATGSATLMSCCYASAQSIHAADLSAPSGVHVAAVAIDNDPTRSSKRQLLGDEQRELEWLLAQSAPLTAAEGSGETILAGFPLSAPESVEEDVAKQHGLELVRRFTIESLNRRIVVYRVRDARAVADVVVALKADQRVSSAQANVRYALPKQQPPERELKQSPQPTGANQDSRRASRPARKIGLPAKSPAMPEGRLKTVEATRTAQPTATLMRSKQQGSLVTGNHAALRWPTADEPFVNVGMTNK